MIFPKLYAVNYQKKIFFYCLFLLCCVVMGNPRKLVFDIFQLLLNFMEFERSVLSRKRILTFIGFALEFHLLFYQH